MESDQGTTVRLALLDAIVDLKHRRPALQLWRPGEGGRAAFADELMPDRPIPAGSR